MDYVDCTLSCSDTNCLIECGRALTDCVQGLRKSQVLDLHKSFRLPLQCELSKWLLQLPKSDLRMWRESNASKRTQFGNMPKGQKC